MINQHRLLTIFIDMARIDAPSLHERHLADWLHHQFSALGCRVREDQTGDRIGGNCGNLYVDFPGERSEPPILFSVHLDRVEPGRQIEPVLGDDGIIRSAGDTILAADDLAGIAAILEMMRSLHETGRPHRPIEVLLSVAEEAHLQGIHQFEPGWIKAKEAYVFDTSGAPGIAVLEAPGHIRLDMTIIGKAAHAGIEPDKGISAITVAAQAIAAMSLGQVDAETTANIGSVSGGGETNIVAKQCQITAECRSRSQQRLHEQADHMEHCVRNAAVQAGAKALVRQTISYLPYRIASDDPVAARFARACQTVGIEPRYISTGGGSDNNVLNRHGITGLVLSCGMQGVHSTHEWLSLRDLVKTAQLAEALAVDPV